jgi:hypothetical protein
LGIKLFPGWIIKNKKIVRNLNMGLEWTNKIHKILLILKMYSLIGRYLKKRFCYPISVFLTTACNTSSCFMFTPRCFPFRKHFVCFEFYSSSGESHRWIRGSSITLGNRIFCFWFCDDYFSEKKTKISLTPDLLI